IKKRKEQGKLEPSIEVIHRNNWVTFKYFFREEINMSEVQMRGKAAKTASYQIVEATTEEKNTALLLIAEHLIKDQATILDENKQDVNDGRENGLDKSVLDRIMLNEERIEAMANAIKSLVDLHDPIGEILEERTLDYGLNVNKVRVPIGVIGMIYEARPN